MQHSESKIHRIVFFDGQCNICNAFIDFILRKDKKRLFQIASFQGKTAQRLLPKINPESIVLLENGELLTESRAIISIVSSLGGIYRIASVAKILPPAVGNYIYRWFAKRRYRFFGKRAACRIPSPSERDLFLE